MNCWQLPKNTLMASLVFGRCGSQLWDVILVFILCYQEEGPHTPCVPGPLMSGLDLPFGANREKGMVERGRRDEAEIFSLCQDIASFHVLAARPVQWLIEVVSLKKSLHASAFSSSNTFLPQYKSIYIHVLTQLFFARVPLSYLSGTHSVEKVVREGPHSGLPVISVCRWWRKLISGALSLSHIITGLTVEVDGCGEEKLGFSKSCQYKWHIVVGCPIM